MSETICEECRVGRYQPTTIPYMHWLGKQMLTFPNAPALVCDVCKHVHYDARFLHSMDYMLDRLAQTASKHLIAHTHAMREEQTGWQSPRR